MIYVEVIFFF